MIETSDQLSELATALSKAQALFKAVPKNKTATIEKRDGGKYSYKYADLADAFEACRGPLAANGLSIVQAPVSPDKGVISVATMLMHASGQWMRSVLTMEAKDLTPQSIGTAITYARRYGLGAMLGLVTDDDTDAQDHQPATQVKGSGAQTGQPGGKAAYAGTTRGEGAPRPAAQAMGVSPAMVKAAYQAAIAAGGSEVEPMPAKVEALDAKTLADWHAYYTSFTTAEATK